MKKTNLKRFSFEIYHQLNHKTNDKKSYLKRFNSGSIKDILETKINLKLFIEIFHQKTISTHKDELMHLSNSFENLSLNQSNNLKTIKNKMIIHKIPQRKMMTQCKKNTMKGLNKKYSLQNLDQFLFLHHKQKSEFKYFSSILLNDFFKLKQSNLYQDKFMRMMKK